MKDNEAGKRHVLQFALKVFLAADNEDRAGQATKYQCESSSYDNHLMQEDSSVLLYSGPVFGGPAGVRG